MNFNAYNASVLAIEKADLAIFEAERNGVLTLEAKKSLQEARRNVIYGRFELAEKQARRAEEILKKP